MKKLLVSFLFLFACMQANAQYRFYAGIQAGPKLSFSTATLIGNAFTREMLNQNTYSKFGNQEGIIVGYNFHNPRFIVEVGYLNEENSQVVKFNKHDLYPTPPILLFSYSGSQESLVFKAILNNITSKITLRSVLGGSYFRQLSGLEFDDESILNRKDKYDIYYFPYVEGQPEKFAFTPLSELTGGGSKRIWMLKTGIEAEAKLNDHLNLSASLIYQSSFKPIISETFQYNYNYQKFPNEHRGTFYEPMQYGSMQSKAEAINLNIGLTYAFGKRKQPSK